MEASGTSGRRPISEKLPQQGARKLRPSVLVVEDDPALRSLLHRMLDSRAEVQCVPNGGKAIEFLGSSPQIDLVISDLNLGDMCAFALLREIEANGERWTHRFLICTGGSVGVEQAVNLEAANIPVLRKPFRAKALRDLVDDLT